MRYSSILIAVLFASGLSFAQINGAPGSNVKSQPLWGPTGYDHAGYYYLPDIDAYYNVPQKKFYTYEEGNWVRASRLPERLKDYDVFTSYKVVINERKPYQNHKKYKEEYAAFKGRRDQEVIRDSNDSRYYVIKGHPEHNKWHKRESPAMNAKKGKSGKQVKKK